MCTLRYRFNVQKDGVWKTICGKHSIFLAYRNRKHIKHWSRSWARRRKWEESTKTRLVYKIIVTHIPAHITSFQHLTQLHQHFFRFFFVSSHHHNFTVQQHRKCLMKLSEKLSQFAIEIVIMLSLRELQNIIRFCEFRFNVILRL